MSIQTREDQTNSYCLTNRNDDIKSFTPRYKPATNVDLSEWGFHCSRWGRWSAELGILTEEKYSMYVHIIYVCPENEKFKHFDEN